MSGLVLVGCIVTLWFGERIGVNGGQGWDGMSYTQWAQDFWRKVVVDGLTAFHSQRVVSSAVVHYGLRILGLRTDVPHVIAGFQALNTIALVGSAVLWAQLSRAMSWPRPAAWVGFVGLFGGYANARHALYYPTLTDPTAFALGMMMAWAYLTRRGWALWLVAGLGGFTWPSLAPLAIGVLVFPRRTGGEPPPERTRARGIAAAVISGTAAVVFVVVALHFMAHPLRGVGDEKFAAWVRGDLLPLTVALLLAMLGLGGYLLLNQPVLWNLRNYLRQLDRRRTMLAVASVAVLLVARALWLRNVGWRQGPTIVQFMCEHTLSAIRGPLWGPVYSVVYFGPIVLIALMYWRRIAAVCADWGPSAVLAMAMTLGFAAAANTRQWNHLLPFLVTATVAATSTLWNTRRLVVFTLLSVAWSKVWLTIGYDVPDNWLRFPNQRYFMNYGPYASDATYLPHLIATVVSFVILAIALRRADVRLVSPANAVRPT